MKHKYAATSPHVLGGDGGLPPQLMEQAEAAVGGEPMHTERMCGHIPGKDCIECHQCSVDQQWLLPRFQSVPGQEWVYRQLASENPIIFSPAGTTMF